MSAEPDVGVELVEVVLGDDDPLLEARGEPVLEAEPAVARGEAFEALELHGALGEVGTCAGDESERRRVLLARRGLGPERPLDESGRIRGAKLQPRDEQRQVVLVTRNGPVVVVVVVVIRAFVFPVEVVAGLPLCVMVPQ